MVCCSRRHPVFSLHVLSEEEARLHGDGRGLRQSHEPRIKRAVAGKGRIVNLYASKATLLDEDGKGNTAYRGDSRMFGEPLKVQTRVPCLIATNGALRLRSESDKPFSGGEACPALLAVVVPSERVFEERGCAARFASRGCGDIRQNFRKRQLYEVRVYYGHDGLRAGGWVAYPASRR